MTNPDGGSIPSETFRYLEGVRTDSFSQVKKHLFSYDGFPIQEIPGCMPAHMNTSFSKVNSLY